MFTKNVILDACIIDPISNGANESVKSARSRIPIPTSWTRETNRSTLLKLYLLKAQIEMKVHGTVRKDSDMEQRFTTVMERTPYASLI